MRRIILTALAAFALSVSACDRDRGDSTVPGERPETVVEAETRVDTVPQEEPAIARSQWRAANEDARSVTGNLRVSLQGRRGGPLVFAYATGVTVTAQPYNVVPADSRSEALSPVTLPPMVVMMSAKVFSMWRACFHS